MKKDVIVKKCKSHRYAMRFCTILFAAFPTVLVIIKPLTVFALPGCVPVLLFIPVMLYYETWQIRFTEKEIVKSVFWKKKKYSYTQIQRAIKGYAFSEKAVVVRVIFLNGKTLQFSKDDENGEKAERILLKHCSVKNISL